MKTLFHYSTLSFKPPPPPPTTTKKGDYSIIPRTNFLLFSGSYFSWTSDWLTKEIPHVLSIYIVSHLPLKGLSGYKEFFGSSINVWESTFCNLVPLFISVSNTWFQSFSADSTSKFWIISDALQQSESVAAWNQNNLTKQSGLIISVNNISVYATVSRYFYRFVYEFWD